jgi:hypothetical protein
MIVDIPEIFLLCRIGCAFKDSKDRSRKPEKRITGTGRSEEILRNETMQKDKIIASLKSAAGTGRPTGGIQKGSRVVRNTS